MDEYVKKHPSSSQAFQYWLSCLRLADWDLPTDIKETFNSADLLGKGCDRVVFNIGGNNYRVICHYHFGKTEVHLYICWIGTHKDYDKLNNKEEQYTINLF